MHTTRTLPGCRPCITTYCVVVKKLPFCCCFRYNDHYNNDSNKQGAIFLTTTQYLQTKNQKLDLGNNCQPQQTSPTTTTTNNTNRQQTYHKTITPINNKQTQQQQQQQQPPTTTTNQQQSTIRATMTTNNDTNQQHSQR